MRKNNVMVYENIAIIMARGGSKSIPRKNVKPLNGVPLLAYTLDAAYGCDKIDLVVFTTDDDELELLFHKYVKIYDPDYSRSFFVRRPDYLGQDHVQVGEVVTHAIRQLEMCAVVGKSIVVLQPTSPFRTYQHIYDAFEQWDSQSTLFSAYSVGGYYWRHDFVHNSPAIPLGHNPASRQGRQWDYSEYSIVKENGALYIMPWNNVSLWGNIRKRPFQVFLMDENDSIDLDTPNDWKKAEELMVGWGNICLKS